MKCPKCKSELKYKAVDNTSKSMEIRYYVCQECAIPLERFIARNNIGLIKSDDLYELDKDGNYIDRWD